MSYRTWSTYGLGICVDDIKTTPERILKLAEMNADTLKDVRKYLDEIYNGSCRDEDLTLEDFDEFEGLYCERGVAAILYEAINEIPVQYADDYDGIQYILYTPTFPWILDIQEKQLTEEDVMDVFRKYVSILTDEPIVIDYYDVENGG